MVSHFAVGNIKRSYVGPRGTINTALPPPITAVTLRIARHAIIVIPTVGGCRLQPFAFFYELFFLFANNGGVEIRWVRARALGNNAADRFAANLGHLADNL